MADPVSRLVLNRAHPLARNLVAAFAFGERGGRTTHDSTRRIAGTLTAGTVWNPDGSLRFVGQRYGVTSTLPVNIGCSRVTTWARVFLPGNTHGTFLKVSGNSLNGWSVGVGDTKLDNNGNHLVILHDGQGWFNTGVNIGFGWHTVAYTLFGSACKSYIDGRLVHQHSTPPTPPTTMGFYIGGHTYNDARSLVGTVDAAYVFSRALTDAEIRALYIDPYAFYLKVSTRDLVAVVTGAVTTTVHLTWTDNSEGEDGFSIERATDGGGFTEINTVTAGVETYDDSPEIGHTYTYRVRATSATLGDSEYSNEAEITV